MVSTWEKLKTCIAICFNLHKVTWQAVYGVWKLLSLPQPMVSIFGGARVKQDDLYAQKAAELGQMLVKNNISVLTGGGPGIMEAVSRGMGDLGSQHGAGISVKGLEDKNPFLTNFFSLGYLFARKWLLTRYSKAYIIFPGGFGTLDELAEVLTLIQTKQVPQIPIILYGSDYWQYFMKWVTDAAVKEGLISTQELSLFVVVDDLNNIVNLVCQECEKK